MCLSPSWTTPTASPYFILKLNRIFITLNCCTNEPQVLVDEHSKRIQWTQSCFSAFYAFLTSHKHEMENSEPQETNGRKIKRNARKRTGNDLIKISLFLRVPLLCRYSRKSLMQTLLHELHEFTWTAFVIYKQTLHITIVENVSSCKLM